MIPAGQDESALAIDVAAAPVDSFCMRRLQGHGLFPTMGVSARGGWAPSSQGSLQSEAVRDAEGKRLVDLCVAGDEQARRRFQEQFAPLVYRFADRCAGSRAVEGGDFYLYLFDDDRLFLRLRGYRGAASLEPFLRGYVLPDLLNQFLVMRARKSLDTVSLDSDCDASAVAASEDDATKESDADRHADGELLGRLPAEKRLLLKLMYIEDFEVDAQEIQLLARRSGRPVRQVIEHIERARESVRARECARREKEEQVESAGQ
jgi:DNA-directed RNA polymerase specialized sigma24 family protein